MWRLEVATLAGQGVGGYDSSMTLTPLAGLLFGRVCFFSGAASLGNSSGTLNVTLSTVNALQGPAPCAGDVAVTGTLARPQIQDAAGASGLATRVTAADSKVAALDAEMDALGSLGVCQHK